MMVFGLLGPSQRHIDRITRGVMQRFAPDEDVTPADFTQTFKARGSIVGRTDEVVDTLGRLAQLGLSEVQLQHLDFDDDDIPEYLAADIAPQTSAL